MNRTDVSTIEAAVKVASRKFGKLERAMNALAVLASNHWLTEDTAYSIQEGIERERMAVARGVVIDCAGIN